MVNRKPYTDLPCNSGVDRPNHNCKDMLRKLQKVDFSMVDTVLYLDAYPHSKEALDYYHKLLEERNRILETMSAEKCPPVTAMNSFPKNEWNWTEGPWPWEPEAN